MGINIPKTLERSKGAKIPLKIMSNFYNVNEVADLLKVSARTVRNLCYSGEIAHNKIGGQIRISQTDLETYLSKTKSNLKGIENNE